MKGLDPLVYGEKVLKEVYDATKNARLIRRLREGRSYGNATTIDVIGCDMLCTYCYVAIPFLTGKGEQLDRELRKKNGARFYEPHELAAHVIETIKKEGWHNQIQITAGEPFITPEWIVEFLNAIAPFSRKSKSSVWIDTNGVRLLRSPSVIEKLRKFEFLRIFISSKNAPPLYTKTSRTDAKYADTAFELLELLWNKRVFALVQAPMPSLWDPTTFSWYIERVSRIHKAAPLLLEVDDMSWLPVQYIGPKLDRVGWTKDKRQSQPKIRAGWQEALENHYDKKMERLADVDRFTEDHSLLPELVFENGDILSCHLFE